MIIFALLVYNDLGVFHEAKWSGRLSVIHQDIDRRLKKRLRTFVLVLTL